MSYSLQPHGLYRPWNTLGQNTGVGSLFLLQGTFLTKGSNQCILHCRQILYQLINWFIQIMEYYSVLRGNELLSHEKKSRDITLSTKVCLVKSYAFSSSHIWMWELDHKESWVPKNWCFWTVVLEKTLESPLDCKEIQPVHPKGDQSWVFIGRTDAKAETPMLWPPHAKNWLIWKNPDAGKDWRQEKGTIEEEMVGWHHQLNGHEFE